jgi:hypothetical protein
MRSVSSPGKARLESFRDALDDLVSEGQRLARDSANQDVIPLFQLFAYGFGFGNPLSFLLGGKGPSVRDLLDLPGAADSTVDVDQLANRWNEYKAFVTGQARQMFGNTPMIEAFTIVKKRFASERSRKSLTEPPILFVLSDGDPTDGPPDSVARLAEELKSSGIFIVSCYVTDHDVTKPRVLYGAPQPGWPPGASLMFECASIVPVSSPFYDYMHENRWEVETNGRLFAQINQSELLSEFIQVVLSPIKGRIASSVSSATTRVFVSYSHHDGKYLDDDSLLGYLKGLERDGFEFWTDRRLTAGDIWDDEIRGQIASADIALVLVSHTYLNSQYCQETEAVAFLREQRRRGLHIVPVILEACDWKQYGWFSDTQCLPRDGKNIESDFPDKGKRAELYLEILQQLRSLGRGTKG